MPLVHHWHRKRNRGTDIQKHGSRQYEGRYESEKYGIRVAAEVTRNSEKKKEQEEEKEEKTSLALRLCKATVMTSNIKPSRSRPRLRPVLPLGVARTDAVCIQAPARRTCSSATLVAYWQQLWVSCTVARRRCDCTASSAPTKCPNSVQILEIKMKTQSKPLTSRPMILVSRPADIEILASIDRSWNQNSGVQTETFGLKTKTETEVTLQDRDRSGAQLAKYLTIYHKIIWSLS